MRSEGLLWFVRGAGLATGAVIILAFAMGALMAAKILVLAFIAVLLAAGLEPFIGWIRARTGLGRTPTILVVYAGFFALTAGLMFLVIPAAINQLNQISVRLPTLLRDVRAFAETLQPKAIGDSIEAVVRLIERTFVRTGTDTPDAQDLIEVGVTLADLVITVITVLALVFFWLTGHQRLQRFVLALLPARRRRSARRAWNEVESRMGLWVRGQLLLMGTIFAMTTVAYFLLGLEGALMLGIIAAIAEAIPIVGPALGAVPALLVAALTGSFELVLIVAAVYVVIQVVEGNILVPIIMRNTIGVPPFLVLVSLFAGAAIGGIVGALLAVPIAAGVVVILEGLQARDSHVPLDGPTSHEAPSGEARERLRRALPDSAAGGADEAPA